MRTAYDPVRIGLLSARTVAAIDALSMLRSSDPAAAGAMRAVRLLRCNLEDLWMPLLRQIEASWAMVTWTTSIAGSAMQFVDDARDDLVGWLEEHADPTIDEQLRAMSDSELRDLLHSGARNYRIASQRRGWIVLHLWERSHNDAAIITFV